ncbi:nucleotide-sugar transporter-domain-containing protein [Xylariales sp. PMI_506]|nr:nucleotide-sugar transporter-domain-containing protein [Xylariales sp. PMI_506]
MTVLEIQLRRSSASLFSSFQLEAHALTILSSSCRSGLSVGCVAQVDDPFHSFKAFIMGVFENGVSLLPAYITFETAKALTTYSATHAGVKISPSFITLCTELAKTSFSILALLYQTYREDGSVSLRAFVAKINGIIAGQSGKKIWMAYATYALPALLYLISNLLYLLAFQFTTPALLHVALLAKLPLTAVIHHVFIRRQRNLRAWASLFVLCIGLVITNASPSVLSQIMGSPADDESTSSSAFGSFLGVIIGLVIAVLSSFTSIYTEVVLKQNVPFWVSQFWLYALGSTFAAIVSLFWDGNAVSSPSQAAKLSAITHKTAGLRSPFLVSSAIILTGTAAGLVVANILRKKDNLVKLVGTSASIVTIIAFQCLLMPELRRSTLTVQTVLGAGLISIATWCYHFYKQQPPPSSSSPPSLTTEPEAVYTSIGDMEEEYDLDAKEKNDEIIPDHELAMAPTPFRVTAAVLFIIFLAIATALFTTPLQSGA